MHSSSKFFLEQTNTQPEIAVILGSGLTNFFETQNINKEKLLNKEKEGKVYENIKKIFDDAELLEVIKKD